MIGYLKGKILSKKPTQSLIDVNGVGYIVFTSINTFEKLPEEGDTISLYTYLAVKEDSLTLFGFYSISEKELFEILISINGVGPKLAQGVLSGIEVEEFKDAIANNNISRLVAIPGVGRKTAERMMIELRDKVDKVSEGTQTSDSKMYSVKEDAITALVGLGYNQKTSDKIIKNILSNNPAISLEDLIRESLKSLSK